MLQRNFCTNPRDKAAICTLEFTGICPLPARGSLGRHTLLRPYGNKHGASHLSGTWELRGSLAEWELSVTAARKTDQ